MDHLRTRRRFLLDLGRTTIAVSVLGAGCTTEPGTTAAGEAESAAGTYRRVDLGVVSAYVVARAGEAAVVDTGVEGSADDIAAVLADLDLGWDAVGHVVVTHAHPDHVGSLADVLTSASTARAYIGAGDLAALERPPDVLTTVADGDTVFGLEVIETPGHTPGHISLLDSALGLLIAGDALNGADGGVVGPDPRFTDDMAVATRSVATLARLTFDTVVFGHGEPVEGDAAAQVAALVSEQ